MTLYTPQHVANFFLDRAEEEAMPLTQLKLMKLVYIAYGWSLAITGEPLFSEPVQAWKLGPVIPSIYHEFKHFGSNAIDSRAQSFDWETGKVTTPRILDTDETTLKILALVWSTYKKFSATALVRKTHEDGTPWAEFYKEGERSVIIEPDKIGSHYKARLNEYIAAAKAA